MQQHATPRWTPPSPTNPGRNYNPFEHAEALGIQVLFRPIRAANEMWLPEHNTIIIKSGMRSVHTRSALAHGVAHAELGHVDENPKHEVLADRLAADNLIDLDDCRRHMRWAVSTAQLAAELEVTTRLLQVFLNSHRLAG